MDLRQLEYFMTVCEELHFTKAAEKLHISQPSLSQQIKNLEFKLGVPLFDRIGRSTAITEAGKILLAHSKRVFYEIEQAEAALNDLNGLRRGSLTVGSLLTCVTYLLPHTILEFKRLYPNIELSILGKRTNDIKKELLENELDLGIAFLPIEHEELESIPLLTEELALAVPVNHPLANRQEVELKEIANVSTVMLPQDFYLRNLIDTYFEIIDLKIKPTLEMSTLESLVQMIAEGVGVTILPAPYLDVIDNRHIKSVKLINPTPKREIGFVYRKNKFMCTATRKFMNQVIETSSDFHLKKQEV